MVPSTSRNCNPILDPQLIDNTKNNTKSQNTTSTLSQYPLQLDVHNTPLTISHENTLDALRISQLHSDDLIRQHDGVLRCPLYVNMSKATIQTKNKQQPLIPSPTLPSLSELRHNNNTNYHNNYSSRTTGGSFRLYNPMHLYRILQFVILSLIISSTLTISSTTATLISTTNRDYSPRSSDNIIPPTCQNSQFEDEHQTNRDSIQYQSPSETITDKIHLNQSDTSSFTILTGTEIPQNESPIEAYIDYPSVGQESFEAFTISFRPKENVNYDQNYARNGPGDEKNEKGQQNGEKSIKKPTYSLSPDPHKSFYSSISKIEFNFTPKKRSFVLQRVNFNQYFYQPGPEPKHGQIYAKDPQIPSSSFTTDPTWEAPAQNTFHFSLIFMALREKAIQDDIDQGEVKVTMLVRGDSKNDFLKSNNMNDQNSKNDEDFTVFTLPFKLFFSSLKKSSMAPTTLLRMPNFIPSFNAIGTGASYLDQQRRKGRFHWIYHEISPFGDLIPKLNKNEGTGENNEKDPKNVSFSQKSIQTSTEIDSITLSLKFSIAQPYRITPFTESLQDVFNLRPIFDGWYEMTGEMMTFEEKMAIASTYKPFCVVNSDLFVPITNFKYSSPFGVSHDPDGLVGGGGGEMNDGGISDNLNNDISNHHNNNNNNNNTHYTNLNNIKIDNTNDSSSQTLHTDPVMKPNYYNNSFQIDIPLLKHFKKGFQHKFGISVTCYHFYISTDIPFQQDQPTPVPPNNIAQGLHNDGSFNVEASFRSTSNQQNNDKLTTKNIFKPTSNQNNNNHNLNFNMENISQSTSSNQPNNQNFLSTNNTFNPTFHDETDFQPPPPPPPVPTFDPFALNPPYAVHTSLELSYQNKDSKTMSILDNNNTLENDGKLSSWKINKNISPSSNNLLSNTRDNTPINPPQLSSSYHNLKKVVWTSYYSATVPSEFLFLTALPRHLQCRGSIKLVCVVFDPILHRDPSSFRIGHYSANNNDDFQNDQNNIENDQITPQMPRLSTSDIHISQFPYSSVASRYNDIFASPVNDEGMYPKSDKNDTFRAKLDTFKTSSDLYSQSLSENDNGINNKVKINTHVMTKNNNNHNTNINHTTLPSQSYPDFYYNWPYDYKDITKIYNQHHNPEKEFFNIYPDLTPFRNGTSSYVTDPFSQDSAKMAILSELWDPLGPVVVEMTRPSTQYLPGVPMIVYNETAFKTVLPFDPLNIYYIPPEWQEFITVFPRSNEFWNYLDRSTVVPSINFEYPGGVQLNEIAVNLFNDVWFPKGTTITISFNTNDMGFLMKRDHFEKIGENVEWYLRQFGPDEVTPVSQSKIQDEYQKRPWSCYATSYGAYIPIASLELGTFRKNVGWDVDDLVFVGREKKEVQSGFHPNDQNNGNDQNGTNYQNDSKNALFNSTSIPDNFFFNAIRLTIPEGLRGEVLIGCKSISALFNPDTAIPYIHRSNSDDNWEADMTALLRYDGDDVYNRINTGIDKNDNDQNNLNICDNNCNNNFNNSNSSSSSQNTTKPFAIYLYSTQKFTKIPQLYTYEAPTFEMPDINYWGLSGGLFLVIYLLWVILSIWRPRCLCKQRQDPEYFIVQRGNMVAHGEELDRSVLVDGGDGQGDENNNQNNRHPSDQNGKNDQNSDASSFSTHSSYNPSQASHYGSNRPDYWDTLTGYTRSVDGMGYPTNNNYSPLDQQQYHSQQHHGIEDYHSDTSSSSDDDVDIDEEIEEVDRPPILDIFNHQSDHKAQCNKYRNYLQRVQKQAKRRAKQENKHIEGLFGDYCDDVDDYHRRDVWNNITVGTGHSTREQKGRSYDDSMTPPRNANNNNGVNVPLDNSIDPRFDKKSNPSNPSNPSKPSNPSNPSNPSDDSAHFEKTSRRSTNNVNGFNAQSKLSNGRLSTDLYDVNPSSFPRVFKGKTMVLLGSDAGAIKSTSENLMLSAIRKRDRIYDR